MVDRVYAFLAVGKGLTEQGDTARYVRVGRCTREDWKRLHHGPSTPEEVLMDVEVPDGKKAMSKMVEILRGNCMYGPKRNRLGGWREELLYEKPAFGLNWLETVYSLYHLQEIFGNIGWELIRPEPEAAKVPTRGSV